MIAVALQRCVKVCLGAGLTVGAVMAVHSPGTHDGEVSIASAQTNIAQLTQESRPVRPVALTYHVLRDNFKTFNTCESYRKNYVVHYPYHLASYCTTTKKSNGRHWLYVAYESCPDVAPRTRPEDSSV